MKDQKVVMEVKKITGRNKRCFIMDDANGLQNEADDKWLKLASERRDWCVYICAWQKKVNCLVPHANQT